MRVSQLGTTEITNNCTYFGHKNTLRDRETRASDSVVQIFEKLTRKVIDQ